MKRSVSMIAAVAENGVIGRAGGLPWSIAEDSRFYWQKVTGQIIILGRHCFGEVDHPAALTIVLSRNPAYEPPPFKAQKSGPGLPRMAWLTSFVGVPETRAEVVDAWWRDLSKKP